MRSRCTFYQQIDWEIIRNFSHLLLLVINGWSSRVKRRGRILGRKVWSPRSARDCSHFHSNFRLSGKAINLPATPAWRWLSTEPSAALLVIRMCLSANVESSHSPPEKICSVLILICKSRLIETFRTWQGFLIDFLVFLNHVALVSTFYLAHDMSSRKFSCRFLIHFAVCLCRSPATSDDDDAWNY